MVGIRTILAAAALVLGASAGVAVADPPPWAHAAKLMGESSPRAHAKIAGTIVGVDFATASIVVATPHGVVPIAVTPSTAIYRGNAFASFGDIGRGAHVEIEAAEINGRLIAQLIQIR